MHSAILLATLCTALVSAIPLDTTQPFAGNLPYGFIDFPSSIQPYTSAFAPITPPQSTATPWLKEQFDTYPTPHQTPNSRDIQSAGYPFKKFPNVIYGRHHLNNYAIVSYLGSGRFGHVFLAFTDGQYVAIKLIDPDVYHPEEFRIQKRLASLDGVVRVLCEFNDAKRKGFVMEAANGGNLESLAKKGMNDTMAKEVMVQLVRTLTDIHSKDITVRDIKPDNVLLFKKDGKLVAKFADFGLAKEGDAPYGEEVGHLDYRAPELVTKQPLAAYKPVDVFALGGTLYSMLSKGAAPPLDKTRTIGKLGVLQTASPEWLAFQRTHPKAAQLAQRMLKTDPKERPTAAEVLALVQDI
jgi:serine/threonine protein kinase